MIALRRNLKFIAIGAAFTAAISINGLKTLAYASDEDLLAAALAQLAASDAATYPGECEAELPNNPMPEPMAAQPSADADTAVVSSPAPDATGLMLALGLLADPNVLAAASEDQKSKKECSTACDNSYPKPRTKKNQSLYDKCQSMCKCWFPTTCEQLEANCIAYAGILKYREWYEACINLAAQLCTDAE